MLVVMIGDCFPDSGHVCPTEQERRVTLLEIFAGALSVNALAIYYLTRGTRAPDDKDDDISN